MRDVQRSLPSLLSKLPLQVIRYGKVVAVLSPPEAMLRHIEDKPPMLRHITPTKDKMLRHISDNFSSGLCKHGVPPTLCKHTKCRGN